MSKSASRTPVSTSRRASPPVNDATTSPPVSHRSGNKKSNSNSNSSSPRKLQQRSSNPNDEALPAVGLISLPEGKLLSEFPNRPLSPQTTTANTSSDVTNLGATTTALTPETPTSSSNPVSPVGRTLSHAATGVNAARQVVDLGVEKDQYTKHLHDLIRDLQKQNRELSSELAESQEALMRVNEHMAAQEVLHRKQIRGCRALVNKVLSSQFVKSFQTKKVLFRMQDQVFNLIAPILTEYKLNPSMSTTFDSNTSSALRNKAQPQTSPKLSPTDPSLSKAERNKLKQMAAQGGLDLTDKQKASIEQEHELRAIYQQTAQGAPSTPSKPSASASTNPDSNSLRVPTSAPSPSNQTPHTHHHHSNSSVDITGDFRPPSRHRNGPSAVSEDFSAPQYQLDVTIDDVTRIARFKKVKKGARIMNTPLINLTSYLEDVFTICQQALINLLGRLPKSRIETENLAQRNIQLVERVLELEQIKQDEVREAAEWRAKFETLDHEHARLTHSYQIVRSGYDQALKHLGPLRRTRETRLESFASMHVSKVEPLPEPIRGRSRSRSREPSPAVFDDTEDDLRKSHLKSRGIRSAGSGARAVEHLRNMNRVNQDFLQVNIEEEKEQSSSPQQPQQPPPAPASAPRASAFDDDETDFLFERTSNLITSSPASTSSAANPTHPHPTPILGHEISEFKEESQSLPTADPSDASANRNSDHPRPQSAAYPSEMARQDAKVRRTERERTSQPSRSQHKRTRSSSPAVEDEEPRFPSRTRPVREMSPGRPTSSFTSNKKFDTRDIGGTNVALGYGSASFDKYSHQPRSTLTTPQAQNAAWASSYGYYDGRALRDVELHGAAIGLHREKDRLLRAIAETGVTVVSTSPSHRQRSRSRERDEKEKQPQFDKYGDEIITSVSKSRERPSSTIKRENYFERVDASPLNQTPTKTSNRPHSSSFSNLSHLTNPKRSSRSRELSDSSSSHHQSTPNLLSPQLAVAKALSQSETEDEKTRAILDGPDSYQKIKQALDALEAKEQDNRPISAVKPPNGRIAPLAAESAQPKSASSTLSPSRSNQRPSSSRKNKDDVTPDRVSSSRTESRTSKSAKPVLPSDYYSKLEVNSSDLIISPSTEIPLGGSITHITSKNSIVPDDKPTSDKPTKTTSTTNKKSQPITSETSTATAADTTNGPSMPALPFPTYTEPTTAMSESVEIAVLATSKPTPPKEEPESKSQPQPTETKPTTKRASTSARGAVVGSSRLKSPAATSKSPPPTTSRKKSLTTSTTTPSTAASSSKKGSAKSPANETESSSPRKKPKKSLTASQQGVPPISAGTVPASGPGPISPHNTRAAEILADILSQSTDYESYIREIEEDSKNMMAQHQQVLNSTFITTSTDTLPINSIGNKSSSTTTDTTTPVVSTTAIVTQPTSRDEVATKPAVVEASSQDTKHQEPRVETKPASSTTAAAAQSTSTKSPESQTAGSSIVPVSSTTTTVSQTTLSAPNHEVASKPVTASPPILSSSTTPASLPAKSSSSAPDATSKPAAIPPTVPQPSSPNVIQATPATIEATPQMMSVKAPLPPIITSPALLAASAPGHADSTDADDPSLPGSPSFGKTNLTPEELAAKKARKAERAAIRAEKADRKAKKEAAAAAAAQTTTSEPIVPPMVPTTKSEPIAAVTVSQDKPAVVPLPFVSATVSTTTPAFTSPPSVTTATTATVAVSQAQHPPVVSAPAATVAISTSSPPVVAASSASVVPTPSIDAEQARLLAKQAERKRLKAEQAQAKHVQSSPAATVTTQPSSTSSNESNTNTAHQTTTASVKAVVNPPSHSIPIVPLPVTQPQHQPQQSQLVDEEKTKPLAAPIVTVAEPKSASFDEKPHPHDASDSVDSESSHAPASAATISHPQLTAATSSTTSADAVQPPATRTTFTFSLPSSAPAFAPESQYAEDFADEEKIIEAIAPVIEPVDSALWNAPLSTRASRPNSALVAVAEESEDELLAHAAEEEATTTPTVPSSPDPLPRTLSASERFKQFKRRTSGTLAAAK